MAQHGENRPIDDALELLKANGFDGLAEAATVLLNSAMAADRSEHLGAAQYERSVSRMSYANSCKNKFLKIRRGMLSLKSPQMREGQFYPQRLMKKIGEYLDRPLE